MINLNFFKNYKATFRSTTFSDYFFYIDYINILFNWSSPNKKISVENKVYFSDKFYHRKKGQQLKFC